MLASSQNFDWSQQKISAEESRQYFDHIDECHDIQRKTITCKICSKRLRWERAEEKGKKNTDFLF